MSKKKDIVVFITNRESKCDECGSVLGRSAWLFINENREARCLSCAELDHLVFLPSGDACLSRRSKKYSKISAVVMKWSRTRKRYERQGILATEDAIEQAEQECLDDAEVREKRRQRDVERREEVDKKYIDEFAVKIRMHYPKLPKGREKQIARHACMKYSGRVGRTAQAKDFNLEAIILAVNAHIRHAETDYDVYLMQGMTKREARENVAREVQAIAEKWGGV